MCFRPALKPNLKTTERQLVAILDRPKPDRLLAAQVLIQAGVIEQYIVAS